MKRYCLTLLTSYFLLLLPAAAAAQIRGAVLDAETGDSLGYVSVAYKQLRYAAISDWNGTFSVPRHNGQRLTFSVVGYKSQTIQVQPSTPNHITIRLKTDARELDEVIVKAKKQKYRRKENPAVTLMKRVIAAKKQNKLENLPQYQYRNYEKLTLALNDIPKTSVDSGVYARKPYLREHLEINPQTGKYTLPVITTEKVTRRLYQRDPEEEKTYIDAERSNGINDIIETGDMFTALAKDVFSEVDIYDNQIRLLRNRFMSPIANGATDFYRFYIVDTVKVDRDSCIVLTFLPNNQQDFGFRGDIWIVNDSSLHVRRVRLNIPKRSDINFVTDMLIEQEYERVAPNSEKLGVRHDEWSADTHSSPLTPHSSLPQWVLTRNDMLVEMKIAGNNSQMLCTRTSRRSDYNFEPINPHLFRGKAKEKYDPYAQMRDHQWWAAARPVPLTTGEAGMDNFVRGLKSTKGFGWAIIAVKAVMENYIETAKQDNPSKVDIGPVTSMLSTNDVDGVRIRPAFQTTANLNPHLFLAGYYARGFKSHENYYSATLTYSFNKKAYLPHEFPKRSISFTSARDIESASDKFKMFGKDNVFTSIRWADVQKLAFYNRQVLEAEREEDWGFAIKGGMKFERYTATDQLAFITLDQTSPYLDPDNPTLPVRPDNRPTKNGSYRTTELYVQLTLAPGQQYMNTKQRRFDLNHEAPIFTLKHTMGISGLMGGQYNYHVTEASVYKRLWIRNCGKMDLWLKGGIQWSRVPFPLLMAPAANLSYIWQRQTFFMVDDMEFLNDKHLSFFSEWDLQGKILNRLPLIKKLKWREHLGVNVLWGSLSDKNNPFLPQNAGDSRLMYAPPTSHVMNAGEPYAEIFIGVHNIFKLLRVDFVRRLNYYDYLGRSRNSVRFGFELTF